MDKVGIWLREGTAEGDNTNGKETLVISYPTSPPSPPSIINSPFDVRLFHLSP